MRRITILKRSTAVLLFLCLLLGGFSKTLLAEEQTKDAPAPESEAAVLIDAETGQVLFDKNGTKQMYPASITKIATGITALEKAEMDEEVTISKKAADMEGTSVYLMEGEHMPLRQLVEGMLINSGNDAATAVAEHISGSAKMFSRKMTRYLKQKTGIEQTSFTNPHGLFAEDHYSTAEDMAKITKYAMKNEDFRDIVSTKTLKWEGEGWETELRNHNQLLWEYDGVSGVKNGYVTEAGFTLVTSAERKGRELIAVVMKADRQYSAYEDSKQLLDYGFDAFEKNELNEGERFQSPDHSLFVIPRDSSFLSLRGAELKTTVNNEGKLIITDKPGTPVFTEKLAEERSKSGAEVKKRAEPSPKEETSNAGTIWKTWAEYNSIVVNTLYYHLQYIL